jgi:hypothetical protein
MFKNKQIERNASSLSSLLNEVSTSQRFLFFSPFPFQNPSAFKDHHSANRHVPTLLFRPSDLWYQENFGWASSPFRYAGAVSVRVHTALQPCFIPCTLTVALVQVRHRSKRSLCLLWTEGTIWSVTEQWKKKRIKNAFFWDIKSQFLPHRKHITSQLQSQAG